MFATPTRRKCLARKSAADDEEVKKRALYKYRLVDMGYAKKNVNLNQWMAHPVNVNRLLGLYYEGGN